MLYRIIFLNGHFSFYKINNYNCCYFINNILFILKYVFLKNER